MDLSERVRSAARVGLPALAAVLAGIGFLYLLTPPLEPGWLYASMSFFTAAVFVAVWVAMGRVPASLVNPLLLVACFAAVAFALGFVAFTGDPGQTTTLLLTMLAAGCLLLDMRSIVAVVLAGTLGWIALLPLLPQAPASHWSIDLVATALIAIVITTVRRRLFFELETLNRQNRLLVDSAGEAIYGVDDAGQITFANPASELVLGRAADQLIGRSEHQLLHLEPQGNSVYSKNDCPFCCEKERVDRTALPLRCPDGQTAWVEITRTNVPPPDALHTVVTLRDVTERTLVQRALRDSEERNRVIVETSLDAVISVDLKARIVGWNRQAERIFGWSCAEAMGLSAFETLVPPTLRESVEEEWDAFRETGHSPIFDRRVETLGMRRDGSEFSMEFSLSRTGTDRDPHFTAFVRDITKRIDDEKRLRQARDAAELAASAKSDFLATMSHEIRTPLNGVFGMTELALDTGDEAERRDFLLRARSCAQSLMTLLNDVLDFSKIEAGHLPIDSIEFDPEKLLDGVIDTVATEAQRKDVELVGSLDATVPSRLIGDPARLRQVLLNLAGNAIKFTERGEVVVHLTLEASEEENEVVLAGRVKDTGIGIPITEQSHIFDAFAQADSSTTRVFGGTGLGLTIAQRLVKLMGGSIALESAPGRGSVFSFGVNLKAIPRVVGEIPPFPRGFRVLVVDDNTASREALMARFRGWNCDAEGAADGAYACSVLREAARKGADYGLVLLDFDMPDPDGLTVARWIRASECGSAMPIVMLKPLSEPPAQELAALGLHDFLDKPIKQKKMRAVLASILEGAGKDRVRASLRVLPRAASQG